MFVNEHIVCDTISTKDFSSADSQNCSLFLVSPNPRLGGANENVCICVACGSRGRETGTGLIHSRPKVSMSKLSRVGKLQALLIKLSQRRFFALDIYSEVITLSLEVMRIEIRVMSRRIPDRLGGS